ncbi:MAG: hypothetical protein VW397_07740 [Candidatus Margulisiibacteriota bacterium]
MNKTIAHPSEKIFQTKDTASAEVDISDITEEDKNKIGLALDRMQLQVSGRLESIDTTTGEITIGLDPREVHPNIIAGIKVAYEICACIKKKIPNKRGKKIPISPNKKERYLNQIKIILESLVKEFGKQVIVEHIIDRISNAKNKAQSKKHYLKLFFMLEKSPSDFAILYIQMTSRLRQYTDGARFCKKELNKDHPVEAKRLINLYLLIFTFLDPTKTEVIGDEAEFLIKQIDECLNSNENDPFFKELKGSLIQYFTFIIEKNLWAFVAQGQTDYLLESILKNISKAQKMPGEDHSLIENNLNMLFDLIKLNEHKGAISSNIVDFLIHHQGYLTQKLWAKLPFIFPILTQQQTDIEPFFASIQISQLENKYLDKVERQKILLLISMMATTTKDARRFLKSALKITHDPNMFTILQIFLKHKSGVEDIIKEISNRSTPYGHCLWLLNQSKNQHIDDENMSHLTQVYEQLLNHLQKKTPLNKSIILESLAHYAKVNSSITDIMAISKKLLETHLHVYSTKDQEWFCQTLDYDDTEHFQHFNATCSTGEVHQLHIQNHSQPHIEGFTANVKNTGSKIPKTRFLKSHLDKNNMTLIKKAWATFDPVAFDSSKSMYWVVKFNYVISNKNDSTLTMQICVLDEGEYSVHIHPSHTEAINAEVS